MNKKYLSMFMAVCVFSSFPSALSCQCVDADCGSVPMSIQARTPQCHHATVQTKGENPTRKECCGKCQIEKAAVLSSEISAFWDVRLGDTWTAIKSFADFCSKLRRPSFSQGEFPESPPGFFEEHILNITFSFRAPPQGCVL